MWDSKKQAEWVRCTNCRHKLFKLVSAGKGSQVEIEAKCHSCKQVVLIKIS